jgi:hypothetical protein
MKKGAPDEFSQAVAFDNKNRNNPLAIDNSHASELFIYKNGPLMTADLEGDAKRERQGKQIPLLVCTGSSCFT